MKVLNLYAGIGGNRKLWDDVKDDLDVTAVEWDSDIADVYRDHFPEDTVVETDAHDYLLDHYQEYDFIWSSPPCPTHSDMRHTFHQDENPTYPDMRLYQEVLLLDHSFEGCWVVENVQPYYEPLITGVVRGRHMFWSDFYIPEMDMEHDGIKRQDSSWEEIQTRYGYKLDGYDKDRRWKRKVLNNCVDPRLGKHVLEAATVDRQATLPGNPD